MRKAISLFTAAIAIAGTIFLAGVPAATAGPFTDDSHDCPAGAQADHCPKQWYFISTLRPHDTNGSGPRDPVNFVFYGGTTRALNDPGGGSAPGYNCAPEDPGFGLVNPDCVARMVTGDGSGNQFQGEWPQMHHTGSAGGNKTISACDTDHYGILTHLANSSGQYTRSMVVNRSVGILTGNLTCNLQFHMRMYSDEYHAGSTPDPAPGGTFVFGGIHHEQRKGDAKHHLDLDWIANRYTLQKNLAEQCSRRRWAYNPGADHNFQNLENDGLVLRVSMSRVSDAEGGIGHPCQGQ